MNGYAPFDLDPFTNGYHQQPPSNGNPQQQRSYQLQGMQVPQPCYEGYDPTLGPQPAPAAPAPASSLIMGFDPLPYNPTAHHTMLQPSRGIVAEPEAFLEPDPIANSVEHRHRQWVPNAAASHADAFFGNSFGDPVDDLLRAQQVGSVPRPIMSLSAPPMKSRKVTNPDAWLESISVEVSGVSLEPMTGSEIIKRVESRTQDVERRYLPCVDFLVSCQQELRAGLAAATQQRMVRQGYRQQNMTPRQFYQRYLEPLANRFYHKNHRLIESSNLTAAYTEVKKLCGDAKKVEYQGCEVMKNTFLGGMKDGESWGLRKWLSKNGGALHVCNDLECILLSCQKLDRNEQNTRRLSERLRPLAKHALDRLKRDVPASYQEQSSAHPYLPFFHRLECALRGLANFDPEDDDVICIDDEDEIEEVKQKASIPKTAISSSTKRSNGECDQGPSKRTKTSNVIGDSSNAFEAPTQNALHVAASSVTAAYGGNGSDDDSDIEVVGTKMIGPGKKGSVSPVPPARASPPAQAPPVIAASPKKNNAKLPLRCARCTMLNTAGSSRCCMCDQIFDRSDNYLVEEDTYDSSETFSDFADIPGMEEETANMAAELWDPPTGPETAHESGAANLYAQSSTTEAASTDIGHMSADDMANRLENMAYLFDANKQNMVRPDNLNRKCFFWDSRVQYASALRLFVDILRNPESRIFVDPVNETELIGYCQIVRHPLCFRDIVTALHGDGSLPDSSLKKWNMWRGKDLLQAIDLVFLNSLAYNGKEKTQQRSRTNSLRKSLWDGINSIISDFLGLDTEKRRECTPTRRGERSGFVIHKASSA